MNKNATLDYKNSKELVQNHPTMCQVFVNLQSRGDFMLSHKIVKFAANSKLYYDYFDQKLHNEDGVVKLRDFGRYEQKLLEFLVDNAERPIS